MSETVQPLKTVGHATPRIDALERVTGRATYTGDVKLPGMLYARVLRSPHPHARIRSIDTAKALALPGRQGYSDARKLFGGLGRRIGGGRYSIQRCGEESH